MSGAAQAGYAPPTGPDEPPPPGRRSRWLLVATVAWAVLLGVLTWVSVRDDGPTVREQRSLAQAGPVVDRAVGELVAAAGDRPVALTPARTGAGCRVTPLLDGATLERGVEILDPAADPRAVLTEVADRLPAGWRAGVRVTGDGPRLRANAGEFVLVEGRPAGDGRIRLIVRTGCRPVGDGYRAPVAQAGPEAGALAAALRALAAPAGSTPELLAAPCPGGDRQARTARVTLDPAPATPAAALAPAAGGAVLFDTPEGYAYRSGGVTVALSGGDLTATTPCL
ncbi:hypothetical protein MCAG_02278 [Micromonospora sp. ATCC 39149]|uniref:Uncharacterized protein n=1 Tax=Micromonospora carbonacea TaxID=47853 RepID=A0A7D6C5C4_9ACTN|nr:hypothetical protein [Micromonospora sp. ATCC 39149]EEP71951.1 hypothetical protein MCAG_02278 [Micromonospora sp. ATCC 39149]QLJ98164.1 hypothetical protein HZU44_26145 [Micromonospora carbonacea]